MRKTFGSDSPAQDVQQILSFLAEALDPMLPPSAAPAFYLCDEALLGLLIILEHCRNCLDPLRNIVVSENPD